MGEHNPAVLAELVSRARRLVQPCSLGNCRHCDHDVDICDCMLSGLRDCVRALDADAPNGGEGK